MNSRSTIPQLFFQRVDQSANQTALRVRGLNNVPQRFTWRKLNDDSLRLACWMIDAGVQTGDRVIQIAENRYEWIVTDLAIQFTGAIHVPLHSQLTAAQVSELIEDCGPGLIVASNRGQLNKLAQIAPKPNLRILTHDRCESKRVQARSLCEVARPSPEQAANVRERAMASVSADSILTILYTSGTTGESKGVVLSQRNVVTNAYDKLKVLELGPSDRRWCMLPMSHIFGRTCDIYTWIIAGCEMMLSAGKDYWLDELAEFRPTYINSVPYFYEKLYRILDSESRLADPNALRQLLGGSIRVCNCGGAAIEERVFDYYRERGINLVTGYGLTETSPVVTSSQLDKVTRGAVGIPLPSVEVRIAPDSEVLVRGPNVMQGYYQNLQATREAIRGGWFHTGDLGTIDDDGFLFIKGRKKELIVTSGGRNVSPVAIERLLNAHPLILQSAVFGDGRDFLTAIIVVDRETIEAKVGNAVVTSDRRVSELFRRFIDQQLVDRPVYEQIGAFLITDATFTLENQLLTPKGSLRRHAIIARYEAALDALTKKTGRKRGQVQF